jgi:hypothetical protein
MFCRHLAPSVDRRLASDAASHSRALRRTATIPCLRQYVERLPLSCLLWCALRWATPLSCALYRARMPNMVAPWVTTRDSWFSITASRPPHDVICLLTSKFLFWFRQIAYCMDLNVLVKWLYGFGQVDLDIIQIAARILICGKLSFDVQCWNYSGRAGNGYPSDSVYPTGTGTDTDPYLEA